MTILSRLQLHASQLPNNVAFRYISEDDSNVKQLTYLELLLSAQSIASELESRVSKGDRVLLFFPPGIEYIKALFGCFIAGVVAVPLYPPTRNVKSSRIVSVAENCQAKLALTVDANAESLQSIWSSQNKKHYPLGFMSIDTIDPSDGFRMPESLIEDSDVAFLQYTSGSTGSPKGVVITHGNIIANASHLSLMSGGSRQDVFVNWLPLFHDMGLVISVLWPVVLGAESNLMSPATFVRSPIKWLQAIQKYQGTICGAPNFAYDLCVEKVCVEDMHNLDLRSWKIAFNAAEPIHASTLSRFTSKFEECGFTNETHYPCYGMAEATVFISGVGRGESPKTVTVKRSVRALEDNKSGSCNVSDEVRFVSCGRVELPHRLVIVQPKTGEELPEGKEGEIWFSGPSISPGYWNAEALNRSTFNQKPILLSGVATEDFMRTGDLGVISDGELFVTGRIKDIFVVNGRNFYPQEIEALLTDHVGELTKGRCAAFSVSNGNVEDVVIAVEVARQFYKGFDADRASGNIRKYLFETLALQIAEVVFIKPFKIPVTSSGKIQRSLVKKWYINGELHQYSIKQNSAGTMLLKPRDEYEVAIYEIFCGALKRADFSINDDFFSLGGDSILCVEVCARVEKSFAITAITAEVLMQYSSVLDLAKYVKFIDRGRFSQKESQVSGAKKIISI